MGVNFRGPFCQLIKRALKTQTQLGINQKKRKYIEKIKNGLTTFTFKIYFLYTLVELKTLKLLRYFIYKIVYHLLGFY